MVIRRSTIVRLAVFWAVVGLCIWYLVARWSTDIEPPFHHEEEGRTEQLAECSEQDPSAADVAIIWPTGSGPGDYFIDTRMERERQRSQQLEWLRSVASDDRLSPEARERAGLETVRLVEVMTREAELENLIRSKGWSDVLVFLVDSSAVVVVRGEELAAADVLCLADMVVRVGGISPDRVSIVSRPD